MAGITVEQKGSQTLPPQEEAAEELALLQLGSTVNRKDIDTLSEEGIYKSIKITGFEPPAGIIAVITEEEIRDRIKDRLPADFVKDVRSIAYVDREESSLGECTSHLDSNKNIITDLSVFQSPFLHEVSTEEEVRFSQALFWATLFHEIGENVLLHLTLEEMDRWRGIIITDQAAVTSFVDKARRQDQTKGITEDFCEAFQMFVRMPSILSILSQMRYRYMYELFLDHLPPCRQEAFRSELYSMSAYGIQQFNRSGLSPEKIREYYLGD